MRACTWAPNSEALAHDMRDVYALFRPNADYLFLFGGEVVERGFEHASFPSKYTYNMVMSCTHNAHAKRDGTRVDAWVCL